MTSFRVFTVNGQLHTSTSVADHTDHEHHVLCFAATSAMLAMYNFYAS